MIRIAFASVSMALESVTAVVDTAMNVTAAVVSNEFFYFFLGIFGFCWFLRS